MCFMNGFFRKHKFWQKLQSNLRIFIGEKPKPTHPKQNGIPENKSLPKTKNRLGPVFLKLERFYQDHIITPMAYYNTCYNKAVGLKCVSRLQNDSHLLHKGYFLLVASALEHKLSWFLGIHLHCHVCTISSLKFSSCNTFIICLIIYYEHVNACSILNLAYANLLTGRETLCWRSIKNKGLRYDLCFSSIVTKGNVHGWIKLPWLQSSRSVSACYVLQSWLNINIISVFY